MALYSRNFEANVGDKLMVKLYQLVDGHGDPTEVDISGGASMAHNELVSRDSKTQWSVGARETGIRNKLRVNGEDVDLSSALTCVVSGTGVHNLLNSSGGDSGSAPSASTLNHLYVSNSQPSHAPNSARMSVTSPTGGYLGTSGHAVHWRHVGAVYLDSSTEIADDWNIAGYHTAGFTKKDDGTTITTGTTWQEWSDLTFENVVVLPNTVLVLAVAGKMLSDNVTPWKNGLKIALDGNEVAAAYYDSDLSSGDNHSISLYGLYAFNPAAANTIKAMVEFYYNSGATHYLQAWSYSHLLRLVL